MFANIFRSLLRPTRPEDDESSSLDVHVDVDRQKDQEYWQRERERERRRAARLNNKSQTTGAGPPIELAPQITYGPDGSVVTDAGQSAELVAPVLKRTATVFPAHEGAPGPMPQAQPHRHEHTKSTGGQQSSTLQQSNSTRKHGASNGTYTMSGAGVDGIYGGAIGAEPTAEECMAMAAAEEETRRREEHEASQPLAPPHPSHSPAISDVDYRTMNLSPGPAPSFIDSAPNPYQYQTGYKESSQPALNTYDPASIRLVNTGSNLHKAAAAALNDSYIPDGPIEDTLFSNFGVQPTRPSEPEVDKSRKRRSTGKPVDVVAAEAPTETKGAKDKEKEKEKQRRRRSRGSSKEVKPAPTVQQPVQQVQSTAKPIGQPVATSNAPIRGKEEKSSKRLRKDKKEKKHKGKDKQGVGGSVPAAGAAAVPPLTQPSKRAAPVPILKPSTDPTVPTAVSGGASKNTTTDSSKRSHRHHHHHHHHSSAPESDRSKKVKVRTPEEEAERKRRKEERRRAKELEKAMNSTIRIVPGASEEPPRKEKEEDGKRKKSRKHKDGHKKKRREGETEEERSERRAARRARKLEESLKAEEEEAAARIAASASASNASLAVPGQSHVANPMDFEYSTRLSTVMEEGSSLAEPAETVPPPPSLSPDPMSPYQEPERFMTPVPNLPELDAAGPSVLHHEDRMDLDPRHHLDPPDIVMKDSYLNAALPSSPLTPLAQAETIAQANISHLALPGTRNSMEEKIPVTAEQLPALSHTRPRVPRTNSMQAPEVVPVPVPVSESKEEKRRRRKEAERIAALQQQQVQPVALATVEPPPAAIVAPEDARAARRRERAAKRTPEEAEARRLRREQRKIEKLAAANAALLSPPQQPGSVAGGSKLSLSPYQMSGAGIKSSSIMGFHRDPRTEPGFGHYGYGTDPRATSNVGFLSPPVPGQSPRHKKSVTIDTGPRDEGPGYIRDGKERQRQKERERARRQREKEAKAAAAAAAQAQADAANPASKRRRRFFIGRR